MFTLKAPAKINWFLNVLGRRDDGYHNIVSVMQMIDLYDTLTFKKADSIIIECSEDIPLNKNLVYKAAILLREGCGVKNGACIRIKKAIPIGAGLGGGSSDAASALEGLNRLWGLGLSKGRLSKLSESIGSDIPFFFNSPIAIISGRGERVKALKAGRSFCLLLVKPNPSVSSRWAYENFNNGLVESGLTKNTAKGDNTKLFIKAIENGDLSVVSEGIFNDLEDAVFRRYPVIKRIKCMLLKTGALGAVMSGSGSTVFGLFKGSKDAIRASKAFTNHWNRVVRTLG